MLVFPHQKSIISTYQKAGNQITECRTKINLPNNKRIGKFLERKPFI